MIRLASRVLSNELTKTLTGLQQKVDSGTDFTTQVDNAQALWKSKGGNAGKIAFEQIRHELGDMCVFVEVCNYCEQSEAADIEHIFPKSFFPELTFAWENYLLACKQCNSGFKLDKCFVISPEGSIIEVTRGQEPGFKTGAFINLRTEDPNNFMALSLINYKFLLLPQLNAKDQVKAHKTLEILQLNDRATLIAARRSAAVYYYARMGLLVKILAAQSTTEIEYLLTPHDDLIDINLPLADIKASIKNNFKNHISSYQHPSVWHSIKTIESQINEKWRSIFTALPEAITW